MKFIEFRAFANTSEVVHILPVSRVIGFTVYSDGSNCLEVNDGWYQVHADDVMAVQERLMTD